MCSHTYDANGNIKTVTVDGELQDTYTYDGLNQLIRHDDAKTEKSYEYFYNNGNLRRIYEYEYTTGPLDNMVDVKLLTYSTGGWKDQLVNFNGKSITYDEIGNVIAYDGNTYDWEKGRQLSSITSEDLNMSFEYNSSGLRTKKVVGDKTTEFYYSGNLLVAQYDGTHWIKFIYAPDGEVVGFTIHDDQGYYDYCYYLKNIQGDIIGIYSNIFQLFREYTYDAWGNVTGIYDEYGRPLMFENDVAHFNPLRYRGYYYDDETGLYYLNSRYYNPEWGSFISADVLTDTSQSVIGTNMYAYCGNNPICRKDPLGTFWIAAIVIVTAIFITAKIVATVKEVMRVDKELSSLPEPTKDISNSFRNTLKGNATEIKTIKNEQGVISASKQFYLKVKNKGDWDLKQKEEYQGTFSLNGCVVQGQDLGNINFGYTGRALGIPTPVLLIGAGVAQILAGTTTTTFVLASNGDDFRDQLFIIYGVMLYNEDF